MLRGPLGDENVKGQFSGHETFPLRHLWLRKAYDAVVECGRRAPRQLFSGPESIVTFGVGKNMATAIRHWALACDVIRLNGDVYEPTPLGDFLFKKRSGRDPFMENPATAWLIHWKLAGRPDRTTTWFYSFNHLATPTFDRSDLVQQITELCEEMSKCCGWKRNSLATIRRDVECFLRSYVARIDEKYPEDSLESVLAQLGLIQPVGSKAFQFRRGPKPSLPEGVFLLALEEFWRRSTGGQATLSVESLTYEPGSPGRVFKLDEWSLVDRLAKIEESSEGRYLWSDTAGVRNVARRKEMIEPLELLDLAYDSGVRGRAA